MKILVYSSCNSSTIAQKYGTAEYSYYFVLKEFLPLLQKIAETVIIENPETEIDAIYQTACSQGERCVFLNFSPPHKAFIHQQCPTIPVLAWEFNDIPSESWGGNPQNDWRLALGLCGIAITHSSHTVKVIKKAIHQDFPAISIPSPVWDRFSPEDRSGRNNGCQSPFSLTISGLTLDSSASDFDCLSHFNAEDFTETNRKIHCSGVVYTSILNPLDGRKNWQDMVTAFCWSLAEHKDATLILKLTNKHNTEWSEMLLKALEKCPDYNCRIVVINGYLEDDSYKLLTLHTSYAVNCSKGEGQCLPLMEYMSAGVPAISPNHTGMSDYINERNSFIVESSLEPTIWPDDTRRMYRSTQSRINWESLCKAFRSAYDTAKHSPENYKKMSESAIYDLKNHCSSEAATKKLIKLIEFQKNFSESVEKL